jgi:hypothetical protein
VVVACSALTFGVVGLESDRERTSSSAVPTPTTTARPYYDHLFLLALGGDSHTVTPDAALGMGRRACSALAEGSSAADIRRVLGQKGLPAEEASRVVMAAVSTLCPDYRQRALD